MKHVLCFGDSNTWGFIPGTCKRYDEHTRWTGILQDELGADWRIHENGQNGRTTVFPEPGKDFMTGLGALPYALDTLRPLDAIIIMLGTNDLLCGASPAEAAERMRIFISDLLVCGLPLLLVAPPLMQSGTWVESDALIRSSGQLAPLYRDLAALCGVSFCDASGWDIPVVFDGVHFSEQGHRRFAEQLEPVFAQTFL